MQQHTVNIYLNSLFFGRFANTVTGQFNGHTHADIFNLFYNTSSDTTQAIGAAFNGASVVTYTNNNPSFKVYYSDAATFVSAESFLTDWNLILFADYSARMYTF